MSTKIAIRFGHALLKNGLKTSANGIVNEYDCVREFGPYVINALTRMGYDVVNVTPQSNKYSRGEDDLHEGINIAKLTGCKIFVSLHLNATKGGKGTETFHDLGNAEAKKLATCINKELVALGFKDRGVKQTNGLAELNTSLTAVLVEGFFIDSEGDVALYKKIGPQKMGEAIAEGVIKFVGGSQSTATKPLQASTPLQNQYRVYGTKLLGNGLTEDYAKTKGQQLKHQGYDVFYIKPDGTKIIL